MSRTVLARPPAPVEPIEGGILCPPGSKHRPHAFTERSGAAVFGEDP